MQSKLPFAFGQATGLGEEVGAAAYGSLPALSLSLLLPLGFLRGQRHSEGAEAVTHASFLEGRAEIFACQAELILRD